MPSVPDKSRQGGTAHIAATIEAARAEHGTVPAEETHARIDMPPAIDLVGLVLAISASVVVVLCFAGLCRRWYNRGRTRRQGSKLRDGALSDASDFVNEDLKHLNDPEPDGDATEFDGDGQLPGLEMPAHQHL